VGERAGGVDSVKQVVPVHGNDHELGGPDPFRPSVPFCYGSDGGTGQTVTADTELVFDTSKVKTNDEDTYRFDDSDPAGLLIIRNGIYRMWASVGFVVGSIGAAKEMYATAQLLSGGPLFGLGSPFGSSTSARLAELGPNQGSSSLSVVSSGTGGIAKSQLYYMGIAPVFASLAAPIRAAVILDHQGTNYTLGNFASVLFIERISGFGSKPPNVDPTA
jgi:hypothetical protein